jgi:hypothetical protein
MPCNSCQDAAEEAAKKKAATGAGISYVQCPSGLSWHSPTPAQWSAMNQVALDPNANRANCMDFGSFYVQMASTGQWLAADKAGGAVPSMSGPTLTATRNPGILKTSYAGTEGDAVKNAWTEYSALPTGLKMYRGTTRLGPDGNWWHRGDDGKIFRAAGPNPGFGVSEGTKGWPNVYDIMKKKKKAQMLGAASSGAAVEITGLQADNACTCETGPTSDGFVSAVPPTDVESLLDPNGQGAGSLQGGPRYAQYKDGAEAEIWRFSNPEGFAQCQCVDPSKVPVNPAPSGTPSTMKSAVTFWGSLGTAGKVGIVAAGAVAAYGAYALVKRGMKKHRRR